MRAWLLALVVLSLVLAATSVPQPRANLQVNDLKCSGCQILVGALETWVTSNSTVTEIVNLVTKICPLLDPSIREVVC
jgi:hypothetical protein